MAESEPPDIGSDDAGLSSLHVSVVIYCDPCKDDGINVEAGGYCEDCTHHLCKTCFKHHLTPKPMRNHKLLDKIHMPKTKQKTDFKDECTDKCSVHKDEILKYFCEDHEKLGCTVCITLEHRTCKVGYIPTLSADLFNSQEYTSFMEKLESIIRTAAFVRDGVKCNLENADKSHARALKAIQTCRKSINSFFDRIENEITSKLGRVREDNRKLIDDIQRENKRMADTLDEIKKDIKEKEGRVQKCRVFFDIKQLSEQMSKLETDLNKLMNSNKIREPVFKQSGSVTRLVQGDSGELGSLRYYCTVDEWDMCDILPDYDGYDDNLDDIIVLSDRKFVVLYSNCCSSGSTIQVISNEVSHKPRVLSSLDTYPGNGRMARMSENKIAVTNQNDIEIYSVTDRFVLTKTLRNVGFRDPIVYIHTIRGGGVFIGVTGPDRGPYKLRMVNMNGVVMRTMSLQIGTGSYFPCYMVANLKQTAIYVSDEVKKVVTCLTLDDEVIGEYKPGSDWTPKGVAVSPDGVVYVCDSTNANIHFLTSDLKPLGLICGALHGIHFPTGLSICPQEHKMYVSMIYSIITIEERDL